MTRIRLIYALLIALSLALHGCGDDGTGAQDASDEKDAASGDSGLDERDPDDLCAGVTCVDDGNVCTANRCDRFVMPRVAYARDIFSTATVPVPSSSATSRAMSGYRRAVSYVDSAYAVVDAHGFMPTRIGMSHPAIPRM